MITAIVVGLALTVLADRDRLRPPVRRIALTGIALFATVKARLLVTFAIAAIGRPPLWDFKVFWMIGHVAAAGRPLYDVASYLPYRALLNPGGDAEFDRIAIAIGMPYPPPAVWLFYPLGFTSNVSAALAMWYVVLFASLAVGIVLLWRQFFAADGVAGLIVAAFLTLALAPAFLTVELAQLDFFAFILLVLVWDQPVPWRAAALLAPLVVIRPLCLVFALSFAVRRQWSALAALAGSLIMLVALSVPLVGTGTIERYFRDNPSARYPQMYFVGTQSLYKLLVTWSHDTAGYFSLARHPLFDAIAVVSLIAATIVCSVSRVPLRSAGYGLLLVLGLLLYPNTDAHYCGLTLVPLCAAWRDRDRLNAPAAVIIAAFCIQYALLDFNSGANTTALVLFFDCVFFGWLALRTPRAVLVY